jgi:hypothetical protein
LPCRLWHVRRGQPADALVYYSQLGKTWSGAYGVFPTADRKGLTLCDGCLDLGDRQMRLGNLHTAGRVQWLRVRCSDLGRWLGYHGRIAGQSGLHGVLDIVGTIRSSRRGLVWIPTGLGKCVHGGRSRCAIDSLETCLDFYVCGKCAGHARVGEAVRVSGI